MFKKCLAIVMATMLVFCLAGCTVVSFDTYTNNAQDQAQDMADNMMGMLGGMSQFAGGLQGNNIPQNTKGPYQVIRAVDGDTFVANIDGVEAKVRLIGVDTPESAATGKNASKNCEEGKTASAYTKSLIEGKNVYIEYDVDQTDDYDRILAYVYLSDGTMLNKHLLEVGYARMMTIQPNVKYVEEFKSIQETARNAKAGFWNGFEQWQEN